MAANNVALGFLKGFGAKVGAVATTVNIDENTLMVVGSNDEDMSLCANALIECGGGVAIADHRAVAGEARVPGRWDFFVIALAGSGAEAKPDSALFARSWFVFRATHVCA